MKKSPILTSAVGVAAVFLTVVAGNYLAGRFPQRIDLTQEKAYTLSEGTRSILSKLDTPVQIRFYCTRNELMPPQLKLYAQQVEDLLNEYRQASKGLVEIQKLNPEPDSDAEDSAKLDGIEGEPLANGDRLYLGLSVSLLDQKEALAFLDPGRERLLEYDLSRAITRVFHSRKAVVGIMSPLPVAGQPMNPMLMQMGQMGRGQDPWVFNRELKRDFEVQEVPFTADKIPDEVKVLVLIHPRGISADTEYAIDQFVLRGGKLIAFLDPAAVLDRQPGGMMGGISSSNLEKLLTAWGKKFESEKVVVDAEYLGRTARGRSPGIIALPQQALSQTDILTAGADNLFLVLAGSFSGTPAEGLKETVLWQSSKNAGLVEPMLAQSSPEEVMSTLRHTDKEFPLAIRLTGKFKTAFPEGKPKPPAPEPKEGEKTGAEPEAALAEASLKESSGEGTVILIGDSDLIQDPAAVVEQQNPFTGSRMLLPANGNLAFAQAAVEQLSGDEALIAVRGRASRERPFTLVRKMEAQAGAVYQSKINELEMSLSDTRRKLGEIQQTQEGNGQRFILTDEQQAEIAKFRKTESDVRKQLKEVRRNLRSDTDALETRMKWINIAAVPVAVALYGVGLGLYQRKRTSAK